MSFTDLDAWMAVGLSRTAAVQLYWWGKVLEGELRAEGVL